MQASRIRSMIRVNHAGEYGACALYQGQKRVLGQHPHYGPLLDHMAQQEQQHRELFEHHMRTRHVRPSALLPVWHVLGYGLGMISARISPEAAMACTVAVEDVIDQHYRQQMAELGPHEPDLLETMRTCHEDEVHHRDLGLQQGAETMPGYGAFYKAVSTATRWAIRIAKVL